MAHRTAETAVEGSKSSAGRLSLSIIIIIIIFIVIIITTSTTITSSEKVIRNKAAVRTTLAAESIGRTGSPK
jgi:uncharacterized protein YpmB